MTTEDKKLRIEKYTYDEISKDYPALHNAIFNQPDPMHMPAVIYVVYKGGAEDAHYIGFLSGYYHDAVTLYIQRAGMLPDSKSQHRFSRGYARAFFSEVMEHLKKEGHVFLLAYIENTNVPALLVALHTGWIINGIHTDTAGKTYVRILKDLR